MDNINNESIFKVQLDSISFREVRVFPSSERYYQMFRSDNATSYVYSESYLAECFKSLEMKFGLK